MLTVRQRDGAYPPDNGKAEEGVLYGSFVAAAIAVVGCGVRNGIRAAQLP